MKVAQHQVNQWLHQRGAWQHVVGNTVIMLAIWGVDHTIRMNLGFSIFYTLPILTLAWYFNIKAGYLASGMAAVLWAIAEASRATPDTTIVFLTWNTGVRLGFWLLLVFLLAELKASYRQEQQLARTDFLTGLLNRRAFAEALAQEIFRASRYSLPFTLVYLDVDNFKAVNDRCGHAAGDDLLQAIAIVLQQTLRSSDPASRLGGDEFACFLPQTNQGQASHLLSRLFDALTHLTNTQAVPIGFSIGAVTFMQAPESADAALAAADKLMYNVKTHGKNQLVQSIYG
ncbi:GGDEF domain-containing protein [Halomicronema sp. CCY15110]|uniref:GGDEF domain-containing protein n=1 Tax=Halomicronema sp. CCY15110 TaxID=2767773 RepID=UPI00194F985E|nr:GGDEF domain-containing protein [Halomicronema sp. CCY15110]